MSAVAAWCALCREPVRLAGPWQPWPEMMKAFHASTGGEKGPGHGDDGWHLAVATTENPVLRRQADELEAEFGRMFRVSVRFGFFRADFSKKAVRELAFHGTPCHYEAGTADLLRPQLRHALARAPRAAEPAP